MLRLEPVGNGDALADGKISIVIDKNDKTAAPASAIVRYTPCVCRLAMMTSKSLRATTASEKAERVKPKPSAKPQLGHRAAA